MEPRNYSLEKHLEALCAADKDYDILLAVWQLNKQNLTAALKEIASTFPHYSEHDITHTIKILDNIQRLLGRERVERLGATDTFLLLMSALTHDLGMYMSYEMIEKKWNTPEMDKLLDEYTDSSDKVIAKAARLLKNHGQRPDNPADGYTWALEIRNAVTLIVAHQMRYKHGTRSADYIKESDFFCEHANRFHFELLPGRYLDLIAQVAHLHGTDFDEVLKTLPHRADGFRGDYIHPRFIACMIRMGDLLDIDNNRFNPYSIALVKEIPDSSEAHYDKHQAVKHLLISPEGIETDLDCPTNDSYRVAREVFDWLECEVEKLSREWSVIAPTDLGGLPPVLHQDKINIYYKGTRTRPELRNLRFDISSRRTFDMLKGGAIYENPGRVFLREIVQNALDATKLQIWADMDTHLPFKAKYGNRKFESKKDLKDYAFSDDIPENIYKKYPVSLKIEYDEKKQAVIVTCEDRGTGISDESLIRMTSQVGESRKADEGYEETIKKMPYFLQPTAAFGLGLQTVFYVADEFTVDTRCPGANARRIIFRSSTNGNYCSLDDLTDEELKEWKDVPHGTKVTIVVDKNHLGKLFELDKENSQELIDNPEAPYFYITIIDRFAERNFENIADIPFSYQSPFSEFQLGEEEKSYKFLSEEGNCRLYWRQTDYVDYLIENRILGGRVFYEHGYRTTFQLRNIPVTGIDGWWQPFTDISLDLYSREADQLVTLSRDGLLPQGEDWCREKIEEILPTIVQMTHKHLLEQYQKDHEEIIKIQLYDQYCNLCLLNWNLPNQIEVDLNPLDDYDKNVELHERYPNYNRFDLENVFFNKQKKILSPKAAIEATEIIAVPRYCLYNDKHLDMLLETAYIGEEDIITNENSTIPARYLCTQVFSIEYKEGRIGTCHRLKEGNPDSIRRVKIDGKDIQKKDVFYILHGFDRDEYSVIVVGKDAPLLGYKHPPHGNCWIYPIKRNIDNDDFPNTRESAEAWLREEGRMEELIPEFLVKIIMKHNILGRTYPPVNEDEFEKYKQEIYDAYICLILDNKFGFKESNQP